MAEGPLTMVMHGGMFGMAAYLAMTQVMQQSPSVALGRSVLVANGVSSYMILFGHGFL